MTEIAFNLTEEEAIGKAKTYHFSDGRYQDLFSVPSDTDEMVAWLARLRLLNGVPFAYLVSDPNLLPRESIRFFYLDRNWTDTLVEGALSVASITSRDRAQLQAAYPDLKDDVDVAERTLFQSITDSDVTLGGAEVATGFLLRSRAVSGWPGVHIAAYRGADSGDEVGIMRIERLAPAVLLVLFDGLPSFVTITEPRQGIQFGVQPHQDDDSFREYLLRDDSGVPQTGDDHLMSFRHGSPGVIHWEQFAADLAEDLQVAEVSSATVGLHMLKFPYQQDFGDPPPDDDHPSTFVSTVPDEHLATTNEIFWSRDL